MILSGAAIREAIDAGHIRIDPFDPVQLNPNSYDLTLGDEVREYTRRELDSRAENPTKLFKINPELGTVVYPGTGALMHTRERIWSDQYVPVIDGKSSIGRLFVWIHVTAGFGDVGFDGQYTLEVSTLYKTRLYAGMRIAQVRFEVVSGKVEQYKGHYQGDAATGAVASRSWQQFEPKARQ